MVGVLQLTVLGESRRRYLVLLYVYQRMVGGLQLMVLARAGGATWCYPVSTNA